MFAGSDRLIKAAIGAVTVCKGRDDTPHSCDRPRLLRAQKPSHGYCDIVGWMRFPAESGYGREN
jgi:hypothetical protein